MAGSNLIYLKRCCQSWHASNDGETALADATDPRGGALLCALPGAVLTGFGTCMFDNRLGATDQTSEAWAIIEARWRSQILFLLIMSLKVE